MGNKMDKPRNDLAAKTLKAMIKNHKKACKRNKVKAEDQVAVLEAVRDALNTIIPRAPNVALNLAGIDDMTPEVVEAAINTVAKDKNVTHVILASCNIGASLVDPLSDMCAQSMLQCINLSHNPLGPDLGAAIGTACMQSPSLKQLYLRNTDLGDDGLERFLGRMSGHATLEVVDLARNNITSAMAERLADFVVSCPNLIGIGLRHNSSLPRATWAEGEIANTLATRYAAKTEEREAAEREEEERKAKEAADARPDGGGGSSDRVVVRGGGEQLTDPMIAGTVDRHPVGIFEIIGCRRTMEDSVIANKIFMGATEQLYGVFDGHGSIMPAFTGTRRVSEICERRLAQRGPTDTDEAVFTQAFRDLDRVISTTALLSGTTAAIVVVRRNEYLSVNTGDSRSVLGSGGSATRLSKDHKLDAEESERIIAAGGTITDGRVEGQLAIPRSLGDANLGEYVIPDPHVAAEPMNENDTSLIIACDGVWDVIGDDLAVTVVESFLDPKAGAEALVQMAYDFGSGDNISVVAVYLDDENPNWEAEAAAALNAAVEAAADASESSGTPVMDEGSPGELPPDGGAGGGAGGGDDDKGGAAGEIIMDAAPDPPAPDVLIPDDVVEEELMEAVD